VLVEALEHVEAASAAGTAQTVGGVGDVLELLQNKPRHHEGAKDKAGLRDVGDAAINDGAGVHEDSVVAAGVSASAKAVAQAAWLFTLALLLIALLTGGSTSGAAGAPGGRGKLAEVIFAQDGGGDPKGSKYDTYDGRQPLAQPQELNLREEDRSQRRHEQPNDETESAGNKIADLGMADHV